MNHNKKNPRSQFIIIRVTPQERLIIEREAKKYKPLGSISTFVRKVLGL